MNKRTAKEEYLLAYVTDQLKKRGVTNTHRMTYEEMVKELAVGNLRDYAIYEEDEWMIKENKVVITQEQAEKIKEYKELTTDVYDFLHDLLGYHITTWEGDPEAEPSDAQKKAKSAEQNANEYTDEQIDSVLSNDGIINGKTTTTTYLSLMGVL